MTVHLDRPPPAASAGVAGDGSAGPARRFLHCLPALNDRSTALGQRLHDAYGNGPQVGMLALESASDSTLTRPYPLDDLVAQTRGMIGYWLIQSLHNAGAGKPILGLITQTEVDPADPAFVAPSKFVGREYSQAQAQRLAKRHGWTVAADGDRWRRVVASPEPRRVVDKDYIAAMLAVAVGADRMLVLTDVCAVMTGFGTPDAAPLSRVSLRELAGRSFPAGSMAPKIEGCRRFVAATGMSAAMGSLTDAAALLAGTAGTTITANTHPHRVSGAS